MASDTGLVSLPFTTSATLQVGSILPMCLGWAGLVSPPNRSAKWTQKRIKGIEAQQAGVLRHRKKFQFSKSIFYFKNHFSIHNDLEQCKTADGWANTSAKKGEGSALSPISCSQETLKEQCMSGAQALLPQLMETRSRHFHARQVNPLLKTTAAIYPNH